MAKHLKNKRCTREGCKGLVEPRLGHPQYYICERCGASYGRLEAAPEAPEGRKDDAEKQRYDLIPFAALAQVVGVLTYGAQKYAPENWRKVEGWRWRYLGAAFRHLTQWARGEKIDPESGHPHLAHALCCLMFLAELDS